MRGVVAFACLGVTAFDGRAVFSITAWAANCESGTPRATLTLLT